METTVNPIEIPMSALSEEALQGLINAFIWREGTDYGWVEASHETKYAQIYKQIQKGDVKILFDPASETVNLISKLDFKLKGLAIK